MNMNRKQAMRWISRSIDGDLSADQEEQLAAYLADHPDLRAMRDEWTSYGDSMRSEIVANPPPATAAWNDVRREIRRMDTPREVTIPWRATVGWATALIVVMLGWARFMPTSPADTGSDGVGSDVEMVDTDLSDATVMVYKDTATDWVIIWVEGPDGNPSDL
jgi:anti-sigma factor RsiW